MILNPRAIKYLFEFLSYRIRRPHRKGHGVHSPFQFDFINQVLHKKISKNQDIVKIEGLKRNLLKDNTIIEVEDFGAGSLRISGKYRKISQVTRNSSTSPKYGRLLFNLVNHYKPDVIIELGCCLGFGTMYMAMANKNGKVYTVDGSQELIKKALQNFERLQFSNIFPTHGIFDNVLPSILKENGKFDLAFVDGNHRKDAMLSYFNLLLPYAHSGSIIVFDDIRWSEEMELGWQEIKDNPDIKLSLDLFQMGIVFFNEKLNKQHFELFY